MNPLSTFFITYNALSGSKYEVSFNDTKDDIKFKKKIGIIFFIILVVIPIWLTVSSIVLPLFLGRGEINLEYLLYSVIGVWCFFYMYSISPYTQKKENYKIDINDDIKIWYKDKEVKFRYIINKNGKIDFEDTVNKQLCISYKDGSKMSKRIKYQIVNYIAMILTRCEIMDKQYLVIN